jgi:hypothetical protein
MAVQPVIERKPSRGPTTPDASNSAICRSRSMLSVALMKCTVRPPWSLRTSRAAIGERSRSHRSFLPREPQTLLAWTLGEIDQNFERPPPEGKHDPLASKHHLTARKLKRTEFQLPTSTTDRRRARAHLGRQNLSSRFNIAKCPASESRRSVWPDSSAR